MTRAAAAAAAAVLLLVPSQPCALEGCKCSGHHLLRHKWTEQQQERQLQSCCEHRDGELVRLLLHLMAASCQLLCATAALL
jgi:hypothetical protein